jgi:hypothetical protein
MDKKESGSDRGRVEAAGDIQLVAKLDELVTET